MSLARRTIQAVAFICTLIVGAASMAVIVTQSAWFKDWLRGFIVRQADDFVNGQLSIGRLDGNLFFGVELEDVRVTDSGGTVVAIEDVGLDYNVMTFLSGRVVLDDVRLNRPVFRLTRTQEGWNIAHLIKARTPDPDEPRSRRPIEIGEIGISDGAFYFESKPVGTSGVELPDRIERVEASIGVTSNEHELNVRIGHVSLRTAVPAFGINSLSGVVRRTGNTIVLDNVSLHSEKSTLRVNGTIDRIESGEQTVDLVVSSGKLDLPEIGRLVPAVRGFNLQPAFEMTMRGPVSRLALDLNLRDATLGNVAGMLTVNAKGPRQTVAGVVDIERFNMAPLLRRNANTVPAAAGARPESGSTRRIDTSVTGRAQIDLSLPSGGRPLRGTYTLRAEYAQAAGYEARDVNATGRIDGRRVDVDGSASAYGGRATAVGTILFGRPLDLALKGRAEGVNLEELPESIPVPHAPSDLQFNYSLTATDRTFVADVVLEESTLAGGTIAEGTTGTFVGGGGTAPSYSADGTVRDLDLQQVGQGFDIGAISDSLYRSRLTATFEVTGSGGGSYPLTLDASGTLAGSELFGAELPLLNVSARFADGNADIAAAGQFINLDPALPTGNTKLAGQLNGAVDARVTLRDYAQGVTVDSVDVTGHANLGSSRVAGFDILHAVVDGTYADRTGKLTQLEVTGPDFGASGRGTIALNETGSSDLRLHLTTPALERVGTIIGRPLKGSAVVDAVVTGNARELEAEGTLQGSNVGYGEHDALSLQSTFTVVLPDLNTASLSVQARSTATFVEVAGLQINEVTAETTWQGSMLRFNGVATQGLRVLAAEGSAAFHPEHREIRLGNLSLKVEQTEWRSVPGSETILRHGANQLRVENFRMANGAQRIDAEGVIGSATEVLKIHAENVDVAELDRLALGDGRFGGVLNADVALSGPLDALRSEGVFTLLNGSFGSYKFESLSGNVNYIARGLRVDVRLQQTAEEWLMVNGYTPLSLFNRRPVSGGGHETPGPGEALDLRVSSSQINLGVIQGFTSYVTNVDGTLQVDVRVSGTPRDPHFHGAIDITGGAFTVPDLGTVYTGFDTRVELTEAVATISEMRIVDAHQQVMTIGGRLGVHELTLGSVDIAIRSTNFEVVDNAFAELRLDTDIRVRGELGEPRIEGFVEVNSSTVDVGRVWAQVTADAGVAPLPEEAGTFSGRAFWDALDMTVGVAIPGNLVVRGRDIRPANAAIGIGDMTVTVGGAVQIRKAPHEQMRVTGEVNTVRGSYTFQGRRFEIMRDGRIRFDGTDEVNPLVDLRARRVISGVETFVHVAGTMREPELTFSSNPPLDEADVLSLIIFNMPINELGEGQQVSLAERAGALAGGYLASGLTRSIANALEIDELEIQAQGSRGLAPALTIGEQIGDRLFFRVIQVFGNEQATEFILEYQIASFLRLTGSLSEITGGTQRVNFRRIERYGLDLFFFFNY